jgi:hypothetical protein
MDQGIGSQGDQPMTASDVQELGRVWEQVKNWAPQLQITLARKILDRVDQAGLTEPRPKRGSPVAKLIGLGAGSGEPPSDEQVRQWIDEHRMEKYGT